jgi:hypothetical protein
MPARFLRPLLRSLVVLLSLLPAGGTLLAQSIVTVAGGGNLDGQKATDLNLHGPLGLAFDRDGGLLVIEQSGNAIRRINLTTGVLTTVTGNGGAGLSGDGGQAIFATVNGPRFLTVDSGGNIYFADHLNDRVRRIDAATGIITTVAGGGNPPEGSIGDGGPATEALVRSPSGVALYGGALYFSESAYNSQRIRKVLLSDMTISTIAGGDTAGDTGDEGQAKDALLNVPTAIAFDAAGNLYVAETEGGRIRKIDAVSGKISTVAGGGNPADGIGDGLPATQAKLSLPTDLAFDAAGDLNIALPNGVRRVDHSSQVITTLFGGQQFPYGIAIDAAGNIYEASGGGFVIKASPPAYEPVTIAGGGTFTGDGRQATSAVLQNPYGVATDNAGNIYIADTNDLTVRKVDAATGIISTVAGNGRDAYVSAPQEGTPATEAIVGYPGDVAVDPAGRFFLISDPLNLRVWKVETAGGTISTLAGGGEPADGIGDGGPATSAKLTPQGVSIEPSGNILIADGTNHRIRRVDASGNIRTIAGSGPAGGSGGFAGDNGPATQALLNGPIKAVADAAGNIYISDSLNGRIRKVDPSGTITTYGGLGSGETLTDDVVATETSMYPAKIDLDPSGNLFLADSGFHRVRRIDAQTRIITTVAGSALHYTQPGFEGDGGPAKNAKMSIANGAGSVTVGPGGDLFIADTNNNRIRAVFSCTAPTGTLTTVPADGALNVATAATLSWSGVNRAFRYDLFLDTVNPPARLLASDLSSTSFVASNLQPSTRYFWRVVSKGDPFCVPLTQLASPVVSFTTGGCGAPAAFNLTAPGDAAMVASPVRLDWQAAGGAGTYDVYAGAGSAPPLVASGLSANTFTLPSLPSGSYTWSVVAHATCDSTKTTRSASRTFTVAGACSAPGSFAIVSPPAGSTVAPSLSLTWTAAANSSSYDIYLGTSSQPSLFAAGVVGTSLAVSGLDPGATYFWRVVARVTCSASLTSSTGVFSFVVRGTCTAPGASTIVFVPPGDVGAGQTYAISWSDAPGLDPTGGYLVERSLDPAFSSIDSSQVTTSTTASFVARTTGTFYHRVRPIPGCNPQLPGPFSESRTVRVVNGAPNVVFSVLPDAVLTSLGERLEQRTTSFTVENLGDGPVQVVLGRSEINSIPFFTIVDPKGGGALATLLPRQPREFEIHFSGPPNDHAGSYQGVIFAASTGGGLAVTPYAFVNLKVGGATGATPRFLSAGTPVEYLAFPGFSGSDDSSRGPVSVDIKNDGATQLEVAAEIGPEVWLRPEAGWNTDPIAPGGTRTVRLYTQRSFAPNGSVLPRYTWFTLRTRDGATARLLVQDNPAASSVSGRRFALGSNDPSIILPEVASRSIAAGSLESRLRLTNSGSEAVEADLVFTPSGADGFDGSAVRTTSIVVPPNDAVTLTDPLVQIFGLTRPVSGSMELRAAREKIGFLSVSSEVMVGVEKGGSNGYQVPPFGRGEGARSGSLQTIPGIAAGGGIVTRIILAETSGVDGASVKLALFDASGIGKGQITRSVPRYGMTEVADVAAAFGVSLLAGGRIDVSIDSGGGSIASLALVTNPATGNAAAFPGGTGRNPAGKLLRALTGSGPAATSIQTYVISDVVNGPLSPSQPYSYQTLVGLRAPAGATATFTMTYIPSTFSGSVPVLTIALAAGEGREFPNILRDAFGLPTGSRGSLRIDGPPDISVYAAILGGEGIPTMRGTLPVIPTFSQILTGGTFAAQRPLYLDGLEQSIDPQRGTHWMVVLNEVGGGSGSVTVGLYEAGNRSRPIGEKEIQIGPHQQITLDSVFSQLDLESAGRSKDRANVLCLVQGKNGAAMVSAVGISIDPRTGKSEARKFEPAGTAGPVSISTAAPIVVPPTTSRKRAVRR